MLQPWIISSWPIMDRFSSQIEQLTCTFRHLGTEASPDLDEFGRWTGRTFWGHEHERIGIAWDWTESLEDVFVISDPMGMATNIEFVTAEGNNVSEHALALLLNNITHELPWQAQASRVTKAMERQTLWHSRVDPLVSTQFRMSELGQSVASR